MRKLILNQSTVMDGDWRSKVCHKGRCGCFWISSVKRRAYHCSKAEPVMEAFRSLGERPGKSKRSAEEGAELGRSHHPHVIAPYWMRKFCFPHTAVPSLLPALRVGAKSPGRPQRTCPSPYQRDFRIPILVPPFRLGGVPAAEGQ